jgi:uncharacterized protein (TIGR03083 family)
MTAPGPTGQPIEELRFALAEADTHRPPSALRSRVLDAVVSARRPGRDVGAGAPITAVEAYRRTMASFDRVLSELTDAEWHLHVLRDLDIQGLVGHLIGVERQLHSALGMEPGVAIGPDHVASTQADALAQAGRPTSETHADWLDLTAATVTHVAVLARADLERPITLHNYTVPVERMLIVRSFETWTHEEDIRRATGRPLAAPDADRLRLMTQLAVAALPAGLEHIGRPKPGRTARIVLTGPGGGTWQASLDRTLPGATDVRVIADATSFCRLVANRLTSTTIDVDVTGDENLAADLLAGAQALALD